MLIQIVFYFILFFSNALSRNLHRFNDLEEEDKFLFRAAYDTPSYDHDEYQQDDDLSLGKLDLLKDGLWMVKAKIKELIAFDKALAANFLSTKLKIKELLSNHLLALKTHSHSHMETEKKKPAYNYQSPSYQQYDQQYAAPQHGAPQYGHDPYYGH